MINYESIERMTDLELLKIVLREKAGNGVADRLFNEFNDVKGILIDAELDELLSVEGVGEQKAAQLKAIHQIVKRLYSYSELNNYKISSPADTAKILIPELQFYKQEHFKVILLNTKNRVIAQKTITVGLLDASLVDPRSVFSYAIRNNAKSVILSHNHPSTDPTPSQEDINITKRLQDAGKIIGINVLDHIIIAGNKYLSLKEENII